MILRASQQRLLECSGKILKCKVGNISKVDVGWEQFVPLILQIWSASTSSFQCHGSISKHQPCKRGDQSLTLFVKSELMEYSLDGCYVPNQHPASCLPNLHQISLAFLLYPRCSQCPSSAEMSEKPRLIVMDGTYQLQRRECFHALAYRGKVGLC